MPDLVTIFNLALAHVGESTQVSDPEESTAVARVCRAAWPQARDATLAEHPWWFARRTATLAEHSPVPTGSAYAYRAPTDAITILGVVPTWADVWIGGEGDVFWTDTSGAIYSGSSAVSALVRQVGWRIGGATDGEGNEQALVLSDTSLDSIRYVRRIENPASYPPIFVDAVSWRLAWDICIPLSRSDGIRTLAYSAFQARLAQAAALDARQGRDRMMPDAEAIVARGW